MFILKILHRSLGPYQVELGDELMLTNVDYFSTNSMPKLPKISARNGQKYISLYPRAANSQSLHSERLLVAEYHVRWS